MPAIKHRNIEKGFGPVTLSDKVKSHDNDPLVIKKVKKATQTLKKVGLPGVKKK